MRSRLVERDAARRTHQVTAVKTHVVRIVVVDHHRSLALPHGLLQALEHPRPDIGLHDQAVDDQLDMVNLIAVEPLAGVIFAYLDLFHVTHHLHATIIADFQRIVNTNSC